MGRPIDEDSVIDIVTYECGEWTGLAKEITKQIKALPSAEPTYEQVKDYCHKRCLSIVDNALLQKYAFAAEPQIISCKDCKYSHMTFDGECKYCDIWFPNEKTYMDGNYFCASAERRQDG